MSLESASWVTQLVSTNPTATDKIGQGDDHLRMIKTVLQNSFPSTSTEPIIPNMATNANKVLTTDGTDSSWSNTLSLSTLSLSSTLNVSGNLTVDTDTLFVDVATDRVGINTASPAHVLDVHNTSGGAQSQIRVKNVNTTGNINSAIYLEGSVDTAQNIIYFGDASSQTVGEIRYNHSTNKFSINVNAAEKFSIESSGNTAITNNLSVGGNLSTTGVVTSVGDTSGVNGLEGFSAFLTSDVDSLSGEQTLKGSSYAWNTSGRYYNDGSFSTSGSTSGEYTVQSTGAYIVTANISLRGQSSWPGTESWRVAVLADGADISKGVNAGPAPYDSLYESSSTYVGILNLNSGEKLTIRAEAIGTGDDWDLIGASFCVRKLL